MSMIQFRVARLSGSRPVAALLVLLTLTGCSVLPESEAVLRLDPQIEADAASDVEASPLRIGVARPTTDPARDSNRIQIRTARGELKVAARLRWVAAAPDLVQNALTRYLRDLGAFAEVSNDASYADRLLQIDLRRFELAESGTGLESVLLFDARVVDTQTGEVLDRRRIEQRAPLEAIEPEIVVKAFERGLLEIAGEIDSLLRP
jgi:ABC-type uncharacterized transport system auxiliary subunit